MPEFFDGVSETTRAVFRKNPLHVAMRGSMKKPAAAEGSGYLEGPLGGLDRTSEWATSGADYGGWEHGVGAATITQQADIAMARNFAKFGNFARGKPSGRLASQVASSSLLPPGSGGGGQGLDAAAGCVAQGRGNSHLPRPAKTSLNQLLGPGDDDPCQGFPGAPGCSRGLPSSSHQLWSFERMPSLVHAPLERDRGKIGRSCAGLPPAARPGGGLLHSAETAPLSPASGGQAAEAVAPTPSPLHRTRSDASIGARRKIGGLHGVIGMTWDNAVNTAGDRTRGSDGRYLGF
mmetsp:Transcript_88428/g.189858  ORF Transcript_88428/g.189858 Transcript_88428/m.189858 type:complete len:291 (-) Transcript_88428:86-958(-)